MASTFWRHLHAEVDRRTDRSRANECELLDPGRTNRLFLQWRNVSGDQSSPWSLANLRDHDGRTPVGIVERWEGPVIGCQTGVDLLGETELAGEPSGTRIVAGRGRHSPRIVGSNHGGGPGLIRQMNLGEETALLAEIGERRDTEVQNVNGNRVRTVAAEKMADLPRIDEPAIRKASHRTVANLRAIDIRDITSVGGDSDRCLRSEGIEAERSPKPAPSVARTRLTGVPDPSGGGKKRLADIRNGPPSELRSSGGLESRHDDLLPVDERCFSAELMCWDTVSICSRNRNSETRS